MKPFLESLNKAIFDDSKIGFFVSLAFVLWWSHYSYLHYTWGFKSLFFTSIFLASVWNGLMMEGKYIYGLIPLLSAIALGRLITKLKLIQAFDKFIVAIGNKFMEWINKFKATPYLKITVSEELRKLVNEDKNVRILLQTIARISDIARFYGRDRVEDRDTIYFEIFSAEIYSNNMINIIGNVINFFNIVTFDNYKTYSIHRYLDVEEKDSANFIKVLEVFNDNNKEIFEKAIQVKDFFTIINNAFHAQNNKHSGYNDVNFFHLPFVEKKLELFKKENPSFIDAKYRSYEYQIILFNPIIFQAIVKQLKL
jgi:hypothetical protein